MASLHFRKRNRKTGFHYSDPGSYFITICVKMFDGVLSNIDADFNLKLNPYGKIIDNKIRSVDKIFRDTEIIEYVIMPDHVHILMNIYPNNHIDCTDGNGDGDGSDRINPVTTNTNTHTNQQSFKYKLSIPSIISWIKGSSSFEINKTIYFRWQRSYYDKIIRHNEEFIKVKNYIINNPQSWITRRSHL
ncbi:MAG: transposase [Candidatus Dojkabacteria bacterium]